MDTLDNWVELAFNNLETCLTKDLNSAALEHTRSTNNLPYKPAYSFGQLAAGSTAISSGVEGDEFSLLMESFDGKKSTDGHTANPSSYEHLPLICGNSDQHSIQLDILHSLETSVEGADYAYSGSLLGCSLAGSLDDYPKSLPKKGAEQRAGGGDKPSRKLAGKVGAISEKFATKAERNAFRAEKNKLAARDFRQRKKEQLARLEAEVEALTRERTSLAAELHRVKSLCRLQVEQLTRERDDALAQLCKLRGKGECGPTLSASQSVRSSSSSVDTLIDDDTEFSTGDGEVCDESARAKLKWGDSGSPKKNSFASCTPYSSLMNSKDNSLHVH